MGVAALNRGLEFLNEGYDAQPISGPLLLLGILAAAVAITGIYSKTVDRSPTLAKATGVFGSLSLLAFLIFLLWTLISRISSIPEAPGPLVLLALISFVVGITLAGVTVIQSSIYPPLVGYLLIAEALALIVVFVTFTLVFPERESSPVLSMTFELAQAIILLAAGYLTRKSTGPQHLGTAF